MVRLGLFLIVVLALIIGGALIVRAVTRGLAGARPGGTSAGLEPGMLQNGAYLALIVLIFGVAVGWLGGL